MALGKPRKDPRPAGEQARAEALREELEDPLAGIDAEAGIVSCEHCGHLGIHVSQLPPDADGLVRCSDCSDCRRELTAAGA
jgi:hypothetical protein